MVAATVGGRTPLLLHLSFNFALKIISLGPSPLVASGDFNEGETYLYPEDSHKPVVRESNRHFNRIKHTFLVTAAQAQQWL